MRANRDADPYIRALNVARIPWRFTGTAGLYRQPEVRVLISFLRAVDDPDDSVSLYDLATSEIFGLAPGDVTLALNRARRRRSPLAHAATVERSPEQIGQLHDHEVSRRRRSMDERRHSVQRVEQKVRLELAAQHFQLRLRKLCSQGEREALTLSQVPLHLERVQERNDTPQHHEVEQHALQQCCGRR